MSEAPFPPCAIGSWRKLEEISLLGSSSSWGNKCVLRGIVGAASPSFFSLLLVGHEGCSFVPTIPFPPYCAALTHVRSNGTNHGLKQANSFSSALVMKGCLSCVFTLLLFSMPPNCRKKSHLAFSGCVCLWFLCSSMSAKTVRPDQTLWQVHLGLGFWEISRDVPPGPVCPLTPCS